MARRCKVRHGRRVMAGLGPAVRGSFGMAGKASLGQSGIGSAWPRVLRRGLAGMACLGFAWTGNVRLCGVWLGAVRQARPGRAVSVTSWRGESC
jgi:hypothetical protein